MFFGVFDFTFVWWIIIGAAAVLVVMGAHEWFKDLNIPMTWWKWLITLVRDKVYQSTDGHRFSQITSIL